MADIYDDPIGNIVLKHEGGFVNDSTDRGGATNFGITHTTLSQWRGYQVSIDEVRNMTEQEARDIYTEKYLKRPGIDRLPFPHPQVQVMDIGINSGPSRGIKFLQEVLNTAGFDCGNPDGVIGDRTVSACEQAQKEMGPYLSNALVERRIRFYLAIIERSPAQGKFKRGWLARANSFRLPTDGFTPDTE